MSKIETKSWPPMPRPFPSPPAPPPGPSVSGRTGKARSKQKRLQWLRSRVGDMRYRAAKLSQALQDDPTGDVVDQAFKRFAAEVYAVRDAIKDWKHGETL